MLLSIILLGAEIIIVIAMVLLGVAVHACFLLW